MKRKYGGSVADALALLKETRTRLADLTGRGERVAEAYPLKRLGEPEDVARAALFLAAETGRWITGQTWVLDGGALCAFG